MANRDLEFALKFRNDAKGVLNAAKGDLRSLAQEAQRASQALKAMNGQGGAAGAFNQTVIAVKQAEQALKRLEIQELQLATAAQKATLAQAALATQEGRNAVSAEKLAQAQNQLTLNTEKQRQAQSRLELQNKKLQDQWDRYNNKTKTLGGSLGQLLGMFLPLSGAFAALKAVQLSDEFTQLQGRVKLATDSLQESREAFAGLLDIAKQTGSGLEAPVSIFQRLSFVRKEIQATLPEMLQFTETVSKLGVASGAGPEALKFGLTQLGQSLSSQIVRAEEFNSIMENIPGVGKAIADELGVTTGQLRQLVINGKVLSKDVFAAMLNASEKANAQFNQMPMTVGRAFQGLLVDLQESIGLFNEASGASDILIFGLQKVGQMIKVIADLLAGFAGIVKSIFDLVAGKIIGVFADAMQFVTDSVNFCIDILNKFKKDKIAHIDLSIGFNSEDMDAARRELAEGDLKKGLDNFKKGFEDAGTVIGVTGEKTEKTAASTRKLSQDYKGMADALGNANKQQQKFLDGIKEQIAMMEAEARTVNMTQKAKERYLAIEKVRQDALKAGIKNFDVSGYVAAYDALEAAKDKVHKDFGTGFNNAMQNFVENAKGMGDLAQDIFQKATDGIDSTVKGLVDGSISSFKDLRSALGNILSDIAADIASFVIKQQIVMPLLKSAFGFSGSFAQGGVFLGGAVQAFASGGIVGGPTAFPMAGGKTGLMGEAGPEAIMPLTRLANGDLGVQAAAGGSTQLNYAPNFNIEVAGGSGGGATSPESIQALARILDQETRKTVMEVLQQQQRPGGLLAGGRNRAN